MLWPDVDETRPPPPIRPAIFLDRDDTLIENRTLPAEAFPGKAGDLFRPGFVRLLDGALEACRALAAAGYALVVVTSQSAVGRGACAIRDVEAANARVRALLTGPAGCPLIECVYASIHHPSEAVAAHLLGEHPWRKPAPGMLLAAARELRLDPARSWMIGDQPRDIEAGLAAGLPRERCVLVGTGGVANADAADIGAAAALVLGERSPGPRATGRTMAVTPTTTVTLQAPDGAPLRDEALRETALAAARAIAERTGVTLLSAEADASRITATLATNRIAAMGFMAELRRATNSWHAAKHGRPLWPEPGTPRGGS